METVLKFDFFVLDFIRNNLTCVFFDGLMVFFTKLGDSGLIWIIFTVIFLITDKYRKVGAAMAVSLIVALFVGNYYLKELVARPRPFQLKEVYILIPKPEGYSFPSGHTMASFAAAFALRLTHKKEGTLAIILAVFIGFSRMYLYVHFFTDVLCGALFGMLFGYVGTAVVYKRLRFKLK